MAKDGIVNATIQTLIVTINDKYFDAAVLMGCVVRGVIGVGDSMFMWI